MGPVGPGGIDIKVVGSGSDAGIVGDIAFAAPDGSVDTGTIPRTIGMVFAEEIDPGLESEDVLVECGAVLVVDALSVGP